MTNVLLASRHHALSEGVWGLLGAVFTGIFTVSDEDSLLEGAARIQPTLIVIDLSLAGGNVGAFLVELKRQAPASKVLLLSVHDEPTVLAAAMSAGADGVVLTRAIAVDLLDAVEAILAGRRFGAPGPTH